MEALLFETLLISKNHQMHDFDFVFIIECYFKVTTTLMFA